MKVILYICIHGIHACMHVWDKNLWIEKSTRTNLIKNLQDLISVRLPIETLFTNGKIKFNSNNNDSKSNCSNSSDNNNEDKYNCKNDNNKSNVSYIIL